MKLLHVSILCSVFLLLGISSQVTAECIFTNTQPAGYFLTGQQSGNGCSTHDVAFAFFCAREPLAKLCKNTFDGTVDAFLRYIKNAKSFSHLTPADITTPGILENMQCYCSEDRYKGREAEIDRTALKGYIAERYYESLGLDRAKKYAASVGLPETALEPIVKFHGAKY